MYKEKLPDDFLDVLIEEVRESQTYSHIPLENRIKVFELDRDEEMINLINEKVIKCREFIRTI
jgi:hypothetical protein